jgi:hypothetical protein
VAIHEAQEKSWRRRMFDAPRTDVTWRATVLLSIGPILLLEEAFYIR